MHALSDEGSARWRWIIVFLFLVMGLATLGDLSHYRGDERFYSDAALEMLRSGDYLTPKFDGGIDRFNKPILNYWLIAGSYHLFGTGVFQTRLPALLAGAGLICLMWPLAMALFQDRRTALLGMGIMACNDQVLSTSVRATTDIVLVCFMTMSLAGMARLIVQGRRDTGSYFMFYVGAGLAVLTKGGWGFMPIAAGWALALLFGRRWGIRLRDLIRWPIMLLAVVIGASWFLLIWGVHGTSALERFFADQAGVRLGSGEDGATRWKNVVTYATTIPLQLLPWSAIAIVVALIDKPAARLFWNRHAKAITVTLFWGVLIVVPLLFANIVRPRYVLMIFPMLAALLGGFILHVETIRADFDMFIRRAIPRVLGVLAVIGIAFAGWGLLIDWRMAGTGAAIALVCGSFAWFARWKPPLTQLLLAALAILLVMRSNDLLGRQVIAASPAPAIAETIEQSMPLPAHVAMDEAVDLGGELRMAMGLDLSLTTLPAGESVEALRNYPALLLLANDARLPALADDYRALPAGHGYINWRNRHIQALLLRPWDKEKVFADRRQDYVLLLR